MRGQLELVPDPRRGDGARSGQVPVGVDRGDVAGRRGWRTPAQPGCSGRRGENPLTGGLSDFRRDLYGVDPEM